MDDGQTAAADLARRAPGAERGLLSDGERRNRAAGDPLRRRRRLRVHLRVRIAGVPRPRLTHPPRVRARPGGGHALRRRSRAREHRGRARRREGQGATTSSRRTAPQASSRISRIRGTATSCSTDGEGGIRTLDGDIHPHNALAGRRLQPLGHFSGLATGYPPDLEDHPFSGVRARTRCRRSVCRISPPSPAHSTSPLRPPSAGFPLFRSGSLSADGDLRDHAELAMPSTLQ